MPPSYLLGVVLALISAASWGGGDFSGERAARRHNAIRKREELLAATKNRKVLETAREKDYRRFLQELERRERLLIDEISIRSYGRTVTG